MTSSAKTLRAIERELGGAAKPNGYAEFFLDYLSQYDYTDVAPGANRTEREKVWSEIYAAAAKQARHAAALKRKRTGRR